MASFLDKLFGSSKTVQATPQVWAAQAPFLQSGLEGARSALNSQQGTPWYTGSLYAGVNPGDTADALSFARRNLAATGGAGDSVSRNLDASSAYGSNSAGIFADLSANPNGAADAGYALANSDIARNLIDTGSRDVVRNLREVEVPGIRRAAIGTGNFGSSKAGAMEAIAARGAGDRIADISARTRGALFDQGSSLYNTNIANRLGANQQVGNAADVAGRAAGVGSDALQSLFGASAFDQGNRQGQVDADFQRWQGQDTRPWDLLQKYWGIAGGNIGQQGQMEQVKTPGILDRIGQVAKVGASVAGLF